MNIPSVLSEWLQAVCMLGAGVLALFLGQRIPARSFRLGKGRPVPAMIPAIVAVFLMLVAAVAAHYQPFRAFLGRPAEHIGEATIGCYALLVLVGIARTRVRSGILGIAICLALVIISLFALCPLYWHYFGRSLYANYPNRNGCIRQTTGFTCGAAAASMLLQQYGFRISEGILAERAGTNVLTGTNEFSLARTLNGIVKSSGFKANAGHLSYRQVRALERPFVAYINIPNFGGHAIMVKSMHPDKVQVSDPLTCESSSMPVAEFKEKWLGTAIWLTGK
jgi:predicted double-glycine peptidase